MKALILGGAGYIGSVFSHTLAKENIELVIYDNLSTGYFSSVEKFKFFHGDILDYEKLKSVLTDEKIDVVFHFAAKCLVAESYIEPESYFLNNVVGGITILKAMRAVGVKKIVFSSSAAVYGIPQNIPLREEHPKNPINTYGHTKLIFENILADYSRAYSFSYVALRYFNAAGASKRFNLGETHNPETHLIPNVLFSLYEGQEFIINGENYPTEDGTCVRDFVHIDDLAEAHILALYKLKESAGFVYNVGTEKGCSIMEVIRASENVTKKRLKYRVGTRRIGDPPILIASPEKIKTELGWKPKTTSVEEIIETQWCWMKKNKK